MEPCVASASASGQISPLELKRLARWHSFQVVFSCLYAGIVLDIVTTAMGFTKAGSGYEQNPAGSLLINDLGWIGLFLLCTGLAVVCYFSVRAVIFRMSIRLSGIVTSLVAIAAFVRWVAVVTAVLFIVKG